MSNDSIIQIGADASQANAEFEKLGDRALSTSQRMQSSIREASEQMTSAMNQATSAINSNFGQIGKMFSKLNGAMMAFSAVLAGGELFKEAISGASKYYEENEKLGRALGITANDAATLNQALGDIHVSTDDYSSAAKGLEKQINKNEEGLNKMGLTTRDSSGHLRPLNDLMLDAIKITNDHREGTDRNVTAIRLFGKGIEDGSRLLELNAQRTEEARKTNEELGLTVGVRGAQNQEAYRKAMKDVGDVMEAVGKVVADALMPLLTQIGQWFRDEAPAAIEKFKVAMNAVAFVCELVWDAFYILWQITTAIGEAIREFALTVIKVVDQILWGLKTLDFSGAKKAWDEGLGNIEDIAKKRFDNIIKEGSKTAEALRGLIHPDTVEDSKNSQSGADASADPKGTKTSRAAEWKAELELMLENEKNYFKDSLQAEIAFWEQKLAQTKKGSKERRDVEHEIYALHKKEAQENFQNEIEGLKAQSAAEQAGGTERIKIAGEIAAKIGDTYGLQSKEYIKALADMTKAAEEHRMQMDKLEDMRIDRQRTHDVTLIEMERDQLKTKKELGQISAQEELAGLQALAEQQYQIELKAAQDKADLIKDDVIAQQAAYDKIQAMAEKHAKDMAQINNQILIEEKKTWDKFSDPIKAAFSKSIDGIIQGTTSLSKALHNIFQSIALEFANLGVKMLADWIMKEVKMTAATILGTQERTAAEETAAGESMVISAGTAIKSIMNDAWEAMAGAYKAIAAIPIVGPFMAPVVAAGAFATVAGFAGSIISAEGGYDIPKGLNPVAQLHQNEMVLPSKYADTIRALSDGGGAGGAPVHVHINAMDAKSVRDYFKANSHTLAPALRNMARNFTPIKV